MLREILGGDIPPLGSSRRPEPSFRLVTKILLRVADFVAISTALFVAYTMRLLLADNPGNSALYIVLTVLVAVAWLFSLSLRGAYEYRYLGVGNEEYRRVITATLWVFGALTIGFYLARVDVARGFVAIALPIGLGLLLAGRTLVRSYLRRRRMDGGVDHRVLVVGESGPSQRLQDVLLQDGGAGFTIVGTCVPDGSTDDGTSLDQIADQVSRLDADVVAVAASERLTPMDLKRIAWSLEGVDVDLVVVPSLADVAGPRIHMRPVAGVPLMYVDQPALSGPGRVAKAVVDRVGAALGLLVLGIPLLMVAAAIRLTSDGPALYRQARAGLNGETFDVLKFRSMYVDSDQRLAELDHLNFADGPLFKVENDPRITPIGRFLRRSSIDELPQLINVLRGEMSLVGPRPFALDTADYADHEHRRHLVRPGITGLWQVHGREEQNWEEVVRLDLLYVENWSLTLDFTILARTLSVALRGT